MDIALEMEFTDKQIQQINAARELKGVFYLSKIAEADGITIQKELCTKVEANYRTTRKQVKTGKPNTRSWNLFMRVICSQCNNKYELLQPLGN